MYDKAFGTFATGSKTASSGTAIAQLVPPWRGAAGSPPNRYRVISGRPNWYGSAFTHLTRLVYAAGSTAHDLVVMRPLNWAIIDGDVAANATGITLKTDPGLYSTSYKYDLGPDSGGVVASVANNAIAAGDYVAYQLRDGTWVLDTIASGTFAGGNIVLTTATPNVTGGGIEDGTALFFFGVAADKDPATGLAHPALTSTASARVDLLGNGSLASMPTLHPGDPVVLYSANASNAGILVTGAGFYGNC